MKAQVCEFGRRENSAETRIENAKYEITYSRARGQFNWNRCPSTITRTKH
jgi:hypothetical protein